MRRPLLIGTSFTVLLLAAACGGDDEPNGSASPEEMSGGTSEPAPTPTPSESETPNIDGILAHLVPSDRRDIPLIIGFPDDSENSPLLGQANDGKADGALPDILDVAMQMLSLESRYEVVAPGAAIELIQREDSITEPAIHLYIAPSSDVDAVLGRALAVTFIDDENTFIIREGLEVGDEPSDLCGLRIGLYTYEGDDNDEAGAALAEFTAACTSVHGREPIEIVEYTEETGFPIDDVIAGELDAAPSSTFHGEWTVSQHAGLSLGGGIYGAGDSLSFLVAQNIGVVNPLADAIDTMVEYGIYQQIMEEHGLPNMPPMPSRVLDEDDAADD